jgi:hypothetical protein
MKHPEPDDDRNELLGGIRGFNSKGLKKAVTNDRSAPIVKADNKGSASGGSGGGWLAAELAAKKKKH